MSNFLKCNCPHCGQPLEYPSEGIGQAIQCPTCDQSVILPPSEQSPTAVSTEIQKDLAAPSEYSEEIKLLHKKAEQGDVPSQGQLGVAYWNGNDVSQNYKEAIKWFAKVVENGADEPYWRLESQVYLGRAYFEGSGVPQDYLQAIKWFAMAAEQGHAFAQTHYRSACCQGGIAYWNGNRGVPQNDNEAVKLFRWAAEEGDMESQTHLGIACIEGRGLPQNNKEAIKWFSKAADQGDDLAQFWLGKCYFAGRGVSQNYVEAYKWASLAAAQGGADPQKFLVDLSAKLSPKQIVEGERAAASQLTKQLSSSDVKNESGQTRQAIPSEVRREVWRRDEGVCVKCGSRENLEYDHIIPVARGGSNTVRNMNSFARVVIVPRVIQFNSC